MLDAMMGDLKQLKKELSEVKSRAKIEGDKHRGDDGKLLNKDLKMTLAELKEQKTSVRVIDGVKFYNQVEHDLEYTPMEMFTQNAEFQVMEQNDKVEGVKTNFSSLLDYFGEDENMTSTDFFNTLSVFLQTFDSTKDSYEKQEAARIKEEKREAAKREKEAKKIAAKKKQNEVLQSKEKLNFANNQGQKTPINGKEALKTSENHPPSMRGVAAMVTTAAALKKKGIAEKPNPMGMGGIAAAAAAAAMKKKQEKTDQPNPNPMGMGGIAAAAAAAALKKQGVTDKPNPNPMGMGGIAAAAAAAAMKKKQETTDKPNPNPMGMGGIAAAAAAAALKKNQDKTDKPNPNPMGMGGIAAAAAAAAALKKKQDKKDRKQFNISGNSVMNVESGHHNCTDSQNRSLVQGSFSLDLMMDRSGDSDYEHVNSHLVRPVARRATCDDMEVIAQELRSREIAGDESSSCDDASTNSKDSNDSFGTDQAASTIFKSKGRTTFNSSVLRPKIGPLLKNKENKKNRILNQVAEADKNIEVPAGRPSFNPLAGGGIAAAAAQAALKRKQQTSTSNQEDDPADGDRPASFNPLAGGGIAAAAAQAAMKRNRNRDVSSYDDKIDSTESTNDSRYDDLMKTSSFNTLFVGGEHAN